MAKLIYEDRVKTFVEVAGGVDQEKVFTPDPAKPLSDVPGPQRPFVKQTRLGNAIVPRVRPPTLAAPGSRKRASAFPNAMDSPPPALRTRTAACWLRSLGLTSSCDRHRRRDLLPSAPPLARYPHADIFGRRRLLHAWGDLRSAGGLARHPHPEWRRNGSRNTLSGRGLYRHPCGSDRPHNG